MLWPAASRANHPAAQDEHIVCPQPTTRTSTLTSILATPASTASMGREHQRRRHYRRRPLTLPILDRLYRGEDLPAGYPGNGDFAKVGVAQLEERRVVDRVRGQALLIKCDRPSSVSSVRTAASGGDDVAIVGDAILTILQVRL